MGKEKFYGKKHYIDYNCIECNGYIELTKQWERKKIMTKSTTLITSALNAIKLIVLSTARLRSDHKHAAAWALSIEIVTWLASISA